MSLDYRLMKLKSIRLVINNLISGSGTSAHLIDDCYNGLPCACGLTNFLLNLDLHISLIEEIMDKDRGA